MKSDLRVSLHSLIPGNHIVEIWHDGEMIGTVTGLDGPGVRIISKLNLITTPEDRGQPIVNAVQVRIVP